MNPLGNISNKELTPLNRILPTDPMSRTQPTEATTPVGVFPRAESILGTPPTNLLNDPYASRQVTWAQNQAASLMTGLPLNPELAEAREIETLYQAGQVGPDIGEPNRERLRQLEAQQHPNGQQPGQTQDKPEKVAPNKASRPSSRKSKPTRKRSVTKRPSKNRSTTTGKKSDSSKTEKKSETKTEPKTTETPKTDSKKADTKTDSIKTEPKKTETPKSETTKTETPRTDTKTDTKTKTETTQTQPNQQETPKTEVTDDRAKQLEAKRKADEIVSKNTTTAGLNYDEQGMGKDLAASKDPQVVRETLKKLDTINRLEVSNEALSRMSDQELKDLSKTPEGREVVSRLGGYGSKDQQERIEKLTGERPRSFNEMSSVPYEGKVPKALEGASADDGRLDVNRVTPEMMNQLTPAERREFLKEIDKSSLWDTRQAEKNPAGTGGVIRKPASQFLLSTLSEQKDSSEAVAKTFASLPPETRSSMILEGNSSKQLVDQMPLVVKELHDRETVTGEPHNGTLKREDALAIANVIKYYPVNSTDDLNTLAERMSQAKDSLPKSVGGKNLEAYNEGWLTGATLLGFQNKGDGWKTVAKGLDLSGDAVDLAGLGTPVSVGIKTGLKVMSGAANSQGESYGDDARGVSTRVKDAWRDRYTDETLGTLNDGLSAGSDSTLP